MCKSLLFLLLFVVNIGSIQSQQRANDFQYPTHGTVNIVLANKNGLVAVADSLLSRNGARAGAGQKLFKLDDKTVCTIADFYSAPGPKIGDTYPLETEVPTIVRYYLAQIAERNRTAVEQSESVISKLKRLEVAYQSALGLLNFMYARFDPNYSPAGAVLTVAGFENSQLVIEGLQLTPKSDGVQWNFVETDRFSSRVTNDRLVSRIKGVNKIGDDIIFNATFRPERLSGDPLLSHFAKEMSRNRGQELGLDDLEEVAKEIERQTARKYPNVVGGAQQVAVLKDGKIFATENVDKLTPLSPNERSPFGIAYMLSGSAEGNRGYIRGIPRRKITDIYRAYFFLDSDVPLDGGIFMESAFYGCTLFYFGRAPVYFDEDNKIDSEQSMITRYGISPIVLRLGPGVAQDDPFIATIRSRFPNLKIEEMKALDRSKLP
jgi:hypothetical protein